MGGACRNSGLFSKVANPTVILSPFECNIGTNLGVLQMRDGLLDAVNVLHGIRPLLRGGLENFELCTAGGAGEIEIDRNQSG